MFEANKNEIRISDFIKSLDLSRSLEEKNCLFCELKGCPDNKEEAQALLGMLVNKMVKDDIIKEDKKLCFTKEGKVKLCIEKSNLDIYVVDDCCSKKTMFLEAKTAKDIDFEVIKKEMNIEESITKIGKEFKLRIANAKIERLNAKSSPEDFELNPDLKKKVDEIAEDSPILGVFPIFKRKPKKHRTSWLEVAAHTILS